MSARPYMLFLAAALAAGPALAKVAPAAPEEEPHPVSAEAAARPIVAEQRDRERDGEGIRQAEEHTLMPEAPEVAVPRLDLESLAGQSGIRGDTPQKAWQRHQAKLQKK